MFMKENAKHLKIRESSLYKITIKSQTTTLKIEFGKNDEVIIRVPYDQKLIKG